MKKVGIIGAMDIEVEALKNEMTVERRLTKARMEFCEGILNGACAVVMKCGIGKVNAALCVQILADLFGVTHIINTGVAGSLNPKLDIGEILISRTALHHDMDATGFGYAAGEVPGMGVTEFPADEGMVTLAQEICGELGIPAMAGKVVSGDVFVSDRETKQRLIDMFRGDCCEMEGASIAHGAYLNGIPFVILRAISDKADDSAHMDYPTFEKQAAANCSRLVTAFVNKL